jgi:hypothetical protein
VRVIAADPPVAFDGIVCAVVGNRLDDSRRERIPTMTRLRFASFMAILALPLVGARFASAEDRPPHQPPPAAFEACQQKKSGDVCEVTFREHTMSGTCKAMPDERLVCHPDHPPGPPPELKAACTDKQAGDSCQATLHDHTINGTCQKGHHDDGLICRRAEASK